MYCMRFFSSKRLVYRSLILTLLSLCFFILMIINCGPGGLRERYVSVGSKNFVEQYIIGNIITLLLEHHGFTVGEKFGTGSMITRMGLLTGQIDIYAEYTGTAWALYLKHQELVKDPVELYQKVKDEDWRLNRVVWLDRTSINNTYALAIRRDDSEKYGGTLSTLSQYVNKHPGETLFGIAHEFYHRPDGFIKMSKTYGMNIDKDEIVTMDIGLSFESISRKQIDVAMVYSTDGKLRKYDLVILKDDRKFFPIYNLCVVVRDEILKQYPEIAGILKPITLLKNREMQDLNYQVEVLGKPSKMVASQFLRKRGLVP